MRRSTLIGRAAGWRTWAASAATVAGVAAGAGFTLLNRLGRTWGSTRRERAMRMPGDEIVREPFGKTMHAVTIDAPPERVWPWLVQMGYHRGGWYTYPWVDRWIWHMDNPSADRILDEFQNLRVGDIVPDGEPGTAYYVVEQLKPARSLVLHSTTHVFPPALRDKVQLNWTWSFLLEPAAGGRSARLLLRVRAEGSPSVAAAFHMLVVPSDFVMARSMLLGIKRRAEDAQHSRQPLPALSDRRRAAATAVPAAVAAVMAVVFPAATRRYGPVRGSPRSPCPSPAPSPSNYVPTSARSVAPRWPSLPSSAPVNTGSVAATLLPHAATDSCGIRAAQTIWLSNGIAAADG